MDGFIQDKKPLIFYLHVKTANAGINANSALNPILYYVMSKRYHHWFSDTKRKVLNLAEKMRIERLAAFRVSKQPDDHPNEIIKYATLVYIASHIIIIFYHGPCPKDGTWSTDGI